MRHRPIIKIESFNKNENRRERAKTGKQDL
jgi:hypothetical protein